MRVDLAGKVALITGAAQRVGRVIALELAEQGVSILVHYNSAEQSIVRKTLHEIRTHGVEAHAAQADLSRAEGVESLLTAAVARFDRLDIVVNNASVFQARDFLDLSLADWNLTMAVNLRAPFLITQRAARIMAENPMPGGVIINICDAGVDGPWEKYPHHGISKSALWMLTQVSALSLGPDIRVNAIVPGPVMKTAGRGATDEEWAKIGQRSVLRKTGSAEDVARAVVYLCGEDHITGAFLHVNAGEHLR
ncbi:MAG: SDR family oxidoreductase [Chloroflexota bacterium]|nr:SDR family oxidoreductase [Chloroflexota bacterium]